MNNVNTYSHIDLSYLELMADGDLDMKKMMLEMLLTELPEELSKMRTLADAEDWEALKSVSHKMKSTLSYVGNEMMTNSNGEIELYTKDNFNLEKIPALMHTLEVQFKAVFPELQQEFDKL